MHSNLNFSLATTYSPLTFFFNIHHEESSFEAIHDHIDSLFGKCAQYVCVNEIRVDWTIYMPSKLYFFPKNINFIRTYIDLQCAEVDLSDLERYFEAVPVQEYVHLGVFMPYSSFSPISKFFKTKSLTISQDKDLAKEVITNFKGRELSLLNMQLDNNDILNFLEQWQSKRILQNLEDWEIGTLKHIYVVEMEKILKSKSFPESIDTKKLGLNERNLIKTPKYLEVMESSPSSQSLTNDLFFP